MTRSQALFAKTQMEAQMASRILVLRRLARHWEIWEAPDEIQWDSDAALLMSGYPRYLAVEWVDPTFHARWIAPSLGNEVDRDLDFRSEVQRRAALDAAQDMHDVIVTQPMELRQGGQGFLVCVPIFSGKTFNGFVVGVFRYRELLDRILEGVAGDYWVAVLDDGERVYGRSASSRSDGERWRQDEKISLGSHTWEVRVWPKSETVARAKSVLPMITLVGGLVVAGLLAAVVYAAQTARFRAREVVAADEKLKKEIAERQQIEQQLRQAQKLEAVGRLAGGVAHDFNNLLLVIRGHALLSLQSFLPEHPLRKNLENILKAAQSASSLTRKLLALGRKQVLQPRVLDLNTLVAQVAELLPPLVGEDIRLVMTLEPGLGRVRADPGQLEHVLVNLVVNARDAMPEGGRLTILTGNVVLDEAASRRFPGVRPGPHVMLAVNDTGHGMDAETLSHAFEPFFTTKEKDKGTGLGLATAYGIVEQSGGAMSVLSEPGRGTTLRIYLPRTYELPEPVEVGKAAAARSLEGSETILLVEDDAAVRKMAGLFLTGKGYTVLEARSGADAIQIAEQTRGSIDLILTDLVMPGMKGRDLAEHISRVRPGVPVLYMSAYTEDIVVNRGILDAGRAFIEKPFGPDDLARKVRELLESTVKRRGAASSG